MREPDAKQPLLELTAVGFSYRLRNGKRQDVLKAVSFKLFEGDSLTLLGASGIGKTTLARICAGIVLPTEGKVYFRGKPLRGPSSSLTLSFQNYPCFPWLDVQANTFFGLRETRSLDAQHRAYAEWLLERVGLVDHKGKYPKQLSGGMLQRLSIARCLAVHPEVLILDEPFSALDRQTKTDLIELLLQLQDAAGFSMISVLHDLEDAYSLADGAVVLAGMPATATVSLRVSGHDQTSFEEEVLEAMSGHRNSGESRGFVLSLLSAIRARQVPDRRLIRRALQGGTPRLLGRRLDPEDQEFVVGLLEERETDRLRLGIRLAGWLTSEPTVQDALCRVWDRGLQRDARLDLALELSKLSGLPPDRHDRLEKEVSLFVQNAWAEFVNRVYLDGEGMPSVPKEKNYDSPYNTIHAYRLLAQATLDKHGENKEVIEQWLRARSARIPQNAHNDSNVEPSDVEA